MTSKILSNIKIFFEIYEFHQSIRFYKRAAAELSYWAKVWPTNYSTCRKEEKWPTMTTVTATAKMVHPVPQKLVTLPFHQQSCYSCWHLSFSLVICYHLNNKHLSQRTSSCFSYPYHILKAPYTPATQFGILAAQRKTFFYLVHRNNVLRQKTDLPVWGPTN